MSNTLYNSLKWIALIFLPAAGAAYFGLGSIWDFPEVDKVVGSVTVVETLLGVLLRKQASDFGSIKTVGDVIAEQHPDGSVRLRYVLDASHPSPTVIQDRKVVQFAVKRELVDEAPSQE